MTKTLTPARAFDTVFVDTIGSLPKFNNGNEYAITILTYFLIAAPFQEKSARTVAKSMYEEFILNYGSMKMSIRNRMY